MEFWVVCSCGNPGLVVQVHNHPTQLPLHSVVASHCPINGGMSSSRRVLWKGALGYILQKDGIYFGLRTIVYSEAYIGNNNICS